MPDDSDTVDSDGTAAFEKSITDNPIQAEANLPQGKKNQVAKVIGRTKEPNGGTFIEYNYNKLFNSMLYDFDSPYGEIK